MIALTPVLGYLIGSLPTANSIAGLWGVDLRASGSRNPGANNAFGLGGYPLGIAVLLIEMAKGVAAVRLGLALGGDWGAALAGIGAVSGNVYNIWYRLQGGKGLGITGGVILGIWPYALPVLVVVMVMALLMTRSSGFAALSALVAGVLASLAWWYWQLPDGWGVSGGAALFSLSLGLAAIMSPRHLHDARHPINTPGPL